MIFFRLATALLVLSSTPGQLHAADAMDASVMIEKVVNMRLSNGFEARMQIEVRNADHRILPPFKLAVIGESSLKQQRLLLRGIAPAKLRDIKLTVEATTEKALKALQSTASGTTTVDPFVPLFDSGLVPWDLMAPWWRWPEQHTIGHDAVDDHACTLIRSFTNTPAGAVSAVISCIDTDTALAWRTQLFDKQHKLLRTITVKRAMRTSTGKMAAKKLSIEQPGINSSKITIYSGDEHYRILPDTFRLPSHNTVTPHE